MVGARRELREDAIRDLSVRSCRLLTWWQLCSNELAWPLASFTDDMLRKL